MLLTSEASGVVFSSQQPICSLECSIALTIGVRMEHMPLVLACEVSMQKVFGHCFGKLQSTNVQLRYKINKMS